MFSIKKNISIRTFFQMFLLISVILPLLISGGIGLYISSDILRKELTLSNKRQLGLIAGHIELFLENPYDILSIAGDQLDLWEELSPELIKEMLRSFIDKYEFFTSIQVADSEGIITGIYPPDDFFLGSDISGRDYFQAVVSSDSPYWAPSQMSDQLDTPVTTLSLPFKNGVITAVLSLEKIRSIIDSSQFIDSDLIVYATDQEGVYISHSDIERVLLQEYDPLFYRYKHNQYSEGDMTVYNDIVYLTSVEIVETSNWMVVLMQPVSSLNEPVKAMAYALMILTVIIIILALFSGNMLRNTFSIPLNALIYSTRGISQGKYDISVPSINFHELSQLADSIGSMSHEIRKREDDLKKARTYLSNIIDSMPSILIGVNPELVITQWNRQAEILSGISLKDAVGKDFRETVPRLINEIPRIEKSIKSGMMQQDLQRIHYHNGEKIIENIVIYPLLAKGVNGAVIRIDDVTEKVMMEEIIIQNEKMLSVGGLAAGMAHEINNPLAGMIQTSSVLANRLGLNRQIPANEKAAGDALISLDSMVEYMKLRKIPEMLESINISGRRISSIVKNMLSFVRNSVDNVSSHDINQILDHSLELAATDYNLKKKFDFKTITIIKEYSLDLPMVVCEMSKIQQVFFNVLQNGAHAMSENDLKKPQFIIKTYFDEPMKMIVVEVTDNGPGMPEKVKKRIFEPFFTTKPVGVGTGLGLSVSYFIITENQNGQMAVESNPGEGATFIVRLPVE